MSSIIIVEGQDKSGKDTQIANISKFFIPNLLVSAKNIKNVSHLEQFVYQKRNNMKMFKAFESMARINLNVLSSRSHLGEYVYGNIYRNYDASYVFDIEKMYLDKVFFSKIILVLLQCDYNKAMMNEDGKSFHNKDKDLYYTEKQLFLEAFDRSIIHEKIIIDRSNISELEVTDKIVTFLKERKVIKCTQ